MFDHSSKEGVSESYGLALVNVIKPMNGTEQ